MSNVSGSSVSESISSTNGVEQTIDEITVNTFIEPIVKGVICGAFHLLAFHILKKIIEKSFK
jgi:catabolite regulation protein CreA